MENISIKDITFEVLEFDINSNSDNNLLNFNNDLLQKKSNFENLTLFHNPIYAHNLNIFKKCEKSCYVILKFKGLLISYMPYGIFKINDNLYEISLGNMSIPFPAIDNKFLFLSEEIFNFIIERLSQFYKDISIGQIKFYIYPQQINIMNMLNSNNFLKKITNSIQFEEFIHTVNLTNELDKIYKNISSRNYRFYKNNFSKYNFEIIKCDSSKLRDEYDNIINLIKLFDKSEVKVDYNKAYELLKNGNAVLYKLLTADKKEVLGIKFVGLHDNYAHDLILKINHSYKNKNISLMLNIFTINDLKNLNIDIFDLGLDSKYSSFFRTVTLKHVAISKNKELLTKDKLRIILFTKYTNLKFAKEKMLNNVSSFFTGE